MVLYKSSPRRKLDEQLHYIHYMERFAMNTMQEKAYNKTGMVHLMNFISTFSNCTWGKEIFFSMQKPFRWKTKSKWRLISFPRWDIESKKLSFKKITFASISILMISIHFSSNWKKEKKENFIQSEMYIFCL